MEEKEEKEKTDGKGWFWQKDSNASSQKEINKTEPIQSTNEVFLIDYYSVNNAIFTHPSFKYAIIYIF